MKYKLTVVVAVVVVSVVVVTIVGSSNYYGPIMSLLVRKVLTIITKVVVGTGTNREDTYREPIHFVLSPLL